jgi:hypothetical protein
MPYFPLAWFAKYHVCPRIPKFLCKVSLYIDLYDDKTCSAGYLVFSSGIICAYPAVTNQQNVFCIFVNNDVPFNLLFTISIIYSYI